jgi:hypothetical protein
MNNIDEVLYWITNPFVVDHEPPPMTIEQAIAQISDQGLVSCLQNNFQSYLNDSVETVEFLPCYDSNIISLNGIEAFTHLRFLDIYNNQVTDLSPLASLTSLEVLLIDMNPISDISVLTSLPNLFDFSMYDINIQDISLLFGLSNQWQMLNLSSASYCWQLSYVENYLQPQYYYPPTSCDISDDSNDFDNDGINNIDEITFGTDPTQAN